MWATSFTANQHPRSHCRCFSTCFSRQGLEGVGGAYVILQGPIPAVSGVRASSIRPRTAHPSHRDPGSFLPGLLYANFPFLTLFLTPLLPDCFVSFLLRRGTRGCASFPLSAAFRRHGFQIQGQGHGNPPFLQWAVGKLGAHNSSIRYASLKRVNP